MTGYMFLIPAAASIICAAAALLMVFRQGKTANIAFALGMSSFAFALGSGFEVIVLALIALFASLTGGALNRGSCVTRNLYRHKFEFREKWMEAARKISSRMTVEEVRQNLKEMIAGSTGASNVRLWLYEKADGSYKAADAGPPLPSDHALIRRLQALRSPFLSGSLSKDRSMARRDLKEAETVFASTGAILAAPLITGGELVGLMLIGPNQTGPFTDEDMELMNLMAAQAAVQIKNIRLNEEVINAKEAEVFHRMSSFIMHDLKNLTHSLSLVSQNARDNISNPDFQMDSVKTINTIVARMQGLIGRLKEEPGEKTQLAEVSIEDALRGAVERLGPQALGKIRISFADGPGRHTIMADTESLETVFVNLLTNALEAVDKDGKIEISVKKPAGSVLVTVSDNGAGIPAQYMSKGLFRPFATTKKTGFGIGLHQCRTIIEAHGGEIAAESEEGKGTVFTIRLPLAGKRLAV